jgi:hypothetical protein
VKIKPGITDILWMAAGAVMLLVVMLAMLHFHSNQTPAELLAFKARRVDLVERMRLALASASEAEKSAVMAITDQDSRTYADQARAATADVERERTELAQLLATGGTQRERSFLEHFSRAFADFQRIDKELLALAVKNTNLKAYTLAFGPAADAVTEMDNALSRLASKSASSPEAGTVAALAFGAQTAALRIQTLLAPHIAEESDKKMDDLEARMATDDQAVRKDLDDLATQQKLTDDPDLKTAVSAYARFGDIRKQILALSRENTNVRSLSISLDQKRKAMFLCQDALASLQQAILEEPIPGVDYGPPANPRHLGSAPSTP